MVAKIRVCYVYKSVRKSKLNQFVKKAFLPDIIECLCDVKNYSTSWNLHLEVFAKKLCNTKQLVLDRVLGPKAKLLRHRYTILLNVILQSDPADALDDFA